MKSYLRKSLLLLLLPIAALAAAGTAAAGTNPGAASRTAPRAGGPPASSGFHVQVTAGHGRLGIAVLEVSPELRTHLGAPADRGVLVDAVRPDSSAARAGLAVGDVVLEVDGEPATSATDMLDAMADRKKGDPIAIAVLRDRRRIDLTATLADDPGPPLPRFRGGRGGPAGGFDLDAPMRELFRGGGLGPWQRELDDARKRIEELEQRLEKIEKIERT